MRHLGLIYTLASVAILACTAVSRAVGSTIERAIAFARECLDLFKPEPPHLATDSGTLVRKIDGNPVARWLQQAMRYETPASYAASS